MPDQYERLFGDRSFSIGNGREQSLWPGDLTAKVVACTGFTVDLEK